VCARRLGAPNNNASDVDDVDDVEDDDDTGSFSSALSLVDDDACSRGECDERRALVARFWRPSFASGVLSLLQGARHDRATTVALC
jgi:hypothetical protein